MIEARGVNGRVAFDGAVVTIFHTGRLAAWTMGRDSKSIPVRHITGVELKPAKFGRGFITFVVPGGPETPSDFGRQTVDAARDENSLLFARRQQADFEQLQQAVEAAIPEVGDEAPPATSRSPAGADSNPLRELRQLGDLFQAGVITRAEFDRAKARLLDRL